jgi:hypothetical protein
MWSLWFTARRRQHLDYALVASDDGMNEEWRNGKDLEGSDCDLTEELSQQLSGSSEVNHEKPQIGESTRSVEKCSKDHFMFVSIRLVLTYEE